MTEVNPQKENGYVAIASEIVEKFCQYRISGEEWQVLWAVLRKTYGWHKKEDFISLSQFQEMTGLRRHYVVRAIKKLIEKGILGSTKNGTNEVVKYRFNKHLHDWVGSTNKGTGSTNIGKKVVPNLVQTIDSITKDNKYLEVFDYWNTKKIVIHKIPSKFLPVIRGCLESYTAAEVKSGIDNYALVLHGKKYYWSCRWSLDQFLQRKNGLDKFLPGNFNEEDYYSKEYREFLMENKKVSNIA